MQKVKQCSSLQQPQKHALETAQYFTLQGPAHTLITGGPKPTIPHPRKAVQGNLFYLTGDGLPSLITLGNKTLGGILPISHPAKREWGSPSLYADCGSALSSFLSHSSGLSGLFSSLNDVTLLSPVWTLSQILSGEVPICSNGYPTKP